MITAGSSSASRQPKLAQPAAECSWVTVLQAFSQHPHGLPLVSRLCGVCPWQANIRWLHPCEAAATECESAAAAAAAGAVARSARPVACSAQHLTGEPQQGWLQKLVLHFHQTHVCNVMGPVKGFVTERLAFQTGTHDKTVCQQLAGVESMY